MPFINLFEMYVVYLESPTSIPSGMAKAIRSYAVEHGQQAMEVLARLRSLYVRV